VFVLRKHNGIDLGNHLFRSKSQLNVTAPARDHSGLRFTPSSSLVVMTIVVDDGDRIESDIKDTRSGRIGKESSKDLGKNHSFIHHFVTRPSVMSLETFSFDCRHDLRRCA
jgi:hypothetical protein